MTHRVLVVDDEAVNRELLRYLLAAEYELLVAENAERGLEVLAQERPDLVILDLHMPGMNGTEFVKRVRAAGDDIAGTRIALYTGTDAGAALRDFMHLMRIDHIIPKPGEPEGILAAVRAALA